MSIKLYSLSEQIGKDEQRNLFYIEPWQEMKNSDEALAWKFKLAKRRLKKLSRAMDPGIIKEALKTIIKHTAEHYDIDLQILIATHELLTNPSPKEFENYRKLALTLHAFNEDQLFMGAGMLVLGIGLIIGAWFAFFPVVSLGAIAGTTIMIGTGLLSLYLAPKMFNYADNNLTLFQKMDSITNNWKEGEQSERLRELGLAESLSYLSPT